MISNICTDPSCMYVKKIIKYTRFYIFQLQGYHEVKARLERAPMIHQCPQCPMEDNMKGKVTRHKVGCDKRYRPERNLEPPHDWEPPAKIPKPPQYNQVRPGVSVLNRTAPNVRGALQQFNQQKQQPNLYSRMPALQFGPGGQRGPARPFFPNKMVNQRQMNLPAFGQVGRLAGNPSVTIQVIVERARCASYCAFLLKLAC